MVEGTCWNGCLAESAPAAVDTCLTVATVAVAETLNVAADAPCEDTTPPGTTPD